MSSVIRLRLQYRLLLLGALVLLFPGAVVPSAPSGTTPDLALRELRAGNRRYVAARVVRPHQNAARRALVAKGQHPFAVVIGCADSRVPPEIVFDQGLGDLFVVRVAGNIADDAVLGSVEYAVEHLGARLIVVLGHERCGAVQAALQGGETPGHVAALVEAIGPAVDAVRGQPGDVLDRAVKANVGRVVGEVKSSKPVLAPLVEAGKVRVVGGYYHLASGAVELK
jgi:carbonic anhydrase